MHVGFRTHIARSPGRRSWILSGLVGLHLAAAGGLAQPPNGAPAPPAADSLDWIRFDSGEWLGGEVKRLRKKVLDFESEQLETLVLDWNDVAELRSPRQYTYVFEGKQTAFGTAVMRKDTMTVATAGGPRAFPRGRLISIVPGGARELDYWSALAHVGWVVRSGNTNQTDLNAVVKVRRAAPLTRSTLDYYGNFGRLSGAETVNNHNGIVKLDAFVSTRWYLTPASFDIFADKFTNITLRVSPGVGIGVQIVDRPLFTVDAELGAAYQWTWFATVQSGEEARTDQGTLVPGVNVSSDLTSELEFDLEYTVRIGVPEVKDSFHHALGILSMDLTGAWSIDLALAWDRVENPRSSAAEVVPQRDDFRFTFGLGIEY